MSNFGSDEKYLCSVCLNIGVLGWYRMLRRRWWCSDWYIPLSKTEVLWTLLGVVSWLCIIQKREIDEALVSRELLSHNTIST